jgi:hypothetical protein
MLKSKPYYGVGLAMATCRMELVDGWEVTQRELAEVVFHFVFEDGGGEGF